MVDLEYTHSVVVARDPGELYDLISDVTRMGQWSPICKACWWDEGDGPRVGARFTGRNVLPTRTWETRSQVVAADPGREFAWEVNDGWVRWGFTFEALERSDSGIGADGGTLLTESWHFLPRGIAGFRDRYGDRADEEIAIRSEAAHTGIPQTLAAIKATAES